MDTTELDHRAEASQGNALDAEDHRLHALRLLESAGRLDNQALDLQAALVHSNLAIAEGQERVAEEIKTFRAELSRERACVEQIERMWDALEPLRPLLPEGTPPDETCHLKAGLYGREVDALCLALRPGGADA